MTTDGASARTKSAATRFQLPWCGSSSTSIGTVIAVAHGEGKVEALRAAMTGDLVNGLVTTHDTAQALLELA